MTIQRGAFVRGESYHPLRRGEIYVSRGKWVLIWAKPMAPQGGHGYAFAQVVVKSPTPRQIAAPLHGHKKEGLLLDSPSNKC